MDSQQLCDVECFMILEEIVVHSYIVLICFFMAIYSMLLRNQSRNRRVIRYCMSAKIPKILSHLNVLIRDNDIVCIDKLRMDRNAFHILASLAKNIGGLTDSKNMSSTEKLAMFLNILAHHEKNRSVKVDYIRSGWSVSRAFNECLRAILKLTPLLLVKPNSVLEDDTDDRWKWFKRARKSTPSSRRVWTPEEELTLVDGLKELCVNGWRGDNGTFRHGYLMELEHYMNARHPNCGLKSLPHVDSKIRAWKKSYATISLLKSRSGLGFQYSDGSILVDDPKAWDDLIKVDPNAKSMNLKKWPLFADWEVIFGKDRATGEFAEGPEDVVEEIERIEAQEITDGMSVGFPIDVVDVDDASGTREDQAAQEEPNVSTGATQSPFTTQDEPNESTGAAQSSFTTQKGETHQSQKQGNSFKASSSKVNEKGRCKKRKTTEDDNETVLKGLMEVMKQFTESHDKRMASLIDKLGERDLS
ncbi:hypothetical protein H5410_031624 [Solanum commersonii]|uniref:DUF8040 domain-containing protein n=1 Tax=Solanum commersonii TaxID=4109 RepID=A0A9J5YMX1_SOLCO|nr:hypothetical protein H5410_031624 [Solanum commersonii]